MIKMGIPIDFVITWVDGSDEEWVKKKSKYVVTEANKSDSGENRYRDYGLLKNWFNRVWKFAPWVHNVFLITDNQAPLWAKNDSRITVVNHTDFIPAKNLPTFNSNVIELNLWRISNLEEHFVCFNDDMYITQSVKPTDFFSDKGIPVLNGCIRPVVPRDDFSKIIFNNMVLVNEIFPKEKYLKKNFKKYFSIKKYGMTNTMVSLSSSIFSNWIGFLEDHLAYPNLKSWFIELNNRHPEVFSVTSTHRFRQADDYSIWLLKNLYLASGNFVPRDKDFGDMMGLKTFSDLKQVKKIIKNRKMVVINDSLVSSEIDEIITELVKIMEI